MKKFIFIIICLFLAANITSYGQEPEFNYRIANVIHVDGNEGWDYLDMEESTGRLFVSHGIKTQVIDSKTGRLMGTIPNTPGVHGIALDPEDNKAFISCGQDSSVVIVNLATLKFIAKVKVTGEKPDAILYDKFSGKVFVFNGRSANATVLDAATNAVVATIPLPGKPEFSVTDGKGNVYVNIEDKSLIAHIDAASLKVLESWPLAPGEEPSGLALDNGNHRLFSVCRNKTMVVMDAQNGKVITTLEIGEGVDGCAFDPVLKRAYSSNGEGTLTVVQEEGPDSLSVLGNLSTARGARTICLDYKTHKLYLPTADYGATPDPTAENPHPRPPILPGSFRILCIETN